MGETEIDEAVPQRRAPLIIKALTRFVLGFAIVGAMFIATAGTTDWWQAWAYMGVLFGCVAVMFTWLLINDPALLERRLRGTEKRGEQRRVQAIGSLVYLAVFILPGLDRRFGWSDIPASLSLAADVIVIAGYAAFAWVLRVNSWASRLVEVQRGQQVISTGPYALVRHPMYSAILVLFGATPIALGSWWTLLPAMLLAPILAIRVRDEEALLLDELPGYAAYTRTTRYRIVPGLW